ncbi:Bug family tripartite tricarboxylate transporter substrate binding protein [Variovorax sp. M-6]|uniref:Bug family tripartite tricarboxylate transporter substrate binding protein n=1 Tax=Variovorax sp. M-6 TaxID=3233041 RepID=UPI003F9B42A7
MQIHRRLLATSLIALWAATPALHAQPSFPTGPVTIVVPYGVGGGVDFFSRTVAVKMGEKLGQPVLVENKPGAGTAIAASDVARAKPDGQRVLIGDVSTFATNPTLYKKLIYDPAKDFTPVSLTGRMPYLLLVNPTVHPQKTLDEFLVAVRKAPPNSISYASAGPGGPGHLTSEMFVRAAGVQMVHVPYKGSGPALPDLLSGQIGVMFMDYGPARAHIASGKLRALAVASTKPIPELPNVPTMAASLPGFESWFWMGMVAPKGTPAPVVDKLRDAYAAALGDPATRQKLIEAGIEPLQSSGAEMDAFIRSEANRWGKVIKEAQIQLD